MSPTYRLLSLLFFAVASIAHGETLSERIDQSIRQALPTYDQDATPIAGDAEFLRRVYLDLAGIIPTAAEAKAFFQNSSPDKRVQLIDKLLASDEYARNQMYYFDNLLMDRRVSAKVSKATWQEFLLSSFKENKPYDQLVREILSADGNDPKTRARSRFYLDRNAEPHQITKDICRVFLGMNLGCCQCHDHPVIDAYKQSQYFGVYAFLSRTYLITDKKTKTGFMAEKGDGETSFESVFKQKIIHKTGPKMFGGKEITEPKFEKGKEYVKVVKAGEIAVPKYSRREQLPKELTATRQFARATVNRLWSAYMGRGLVHPLENDHVGNPPSHPELLDELTDAFIQDNYDLKKFVRSLVLTQTYQRSSETRNDGKTPDPQWFAVAPLRPLSPEQFGWSVIQGTGQLQADREATPKTKDFTAKYATFINTFVTTFGGTEGEPSNPDFETTLDQTLFLNNGGVLQNWLNRRNGCLTDRLNSLKDGKEIAEDLYLSLLTRMPTDDESREIGEIMKGSKDSLRTIQNLVWSLVTSAEFRFNH